MAIRTSSSSATYDSPASELADLREKEARFRWLFDNTSEAIWRFEVAPPIPARLSAAELIPLIYERAYLAECNMGMVRMYGFTSADEMVGLRLQEIMPREQPENVAYLEAFHAAGYRIQDAESVECDAAGRPIYLVNSLIGILADGMIVGAWGTSRDVTAGKLAEQRVRESEERLRLIVESATEFAIFTLDLKGMVTSWNSGAEAIIGFKESEILGRDGRAIFTPEDRERGVPEREMEDAASNGRATDERWHVRGGGGRFWGSGIVTPLRDTSGSISGYLKIMQDTTAQREMIDALRATQQRFKLVLESSQIGFWYSDLPLKDLVWDAQVKTHFGLPLDAEVTIDLFFKALHPDDRERTRQAMERCIQNTATYDIDYRTVAADGTVRWIHAMGRVYAATGSAARRFDGITIDITDRKQVELALARAKREAETANRAKDDFLAALSHELRTPLAPVLMTLSALHEEEGLSPGVRQDLDMIRRNVELETKLIDDLLDLTRIVRGKVELRVETVDVHAILEHTMHTCSDGDFRGKEVALLPQFAAVEHHVSGDSARLQQVFWNLLKNALKFTPVGGRVHIRTMNLKPGILRVEVQDTGIGIEKSQILQLFRAFEQGGREITRRFGGLGLGLAISKRVIELHGGHIRAESPGRDRGATFIVEITTVAAPSGDAKPDGPLLHAPQGATDAMRRVLLVEDHEPTSQILRRLLERRGHTVESAATLAEARALVLVNTFDLLISDLGLPDGSGHDLMRELKTRFGLPGIALSGYGMESDVAASLAAGFAAHLVKPVDWQRLETVLIKLTPAPDTLRA